MNFFDLPGPQFLVFYAMLAFAVVVVTRSLRAAGEDGRMPRFDVVDAYLVAYLRGGAKEATLVASLSLVDRGLLKVDGTRMGTADARTTEAVNRPLERAILKACTVPRTITDLFSEPETVSAAHLLEPELRKRRLLPDSRQRVRRLVLATVAVAILLGVAFTKVQIALARGRHNIVFLLIMAVIAVWVVLKQIFVARTRLGDRALEDLTQLFENLRQRAADLEAGGATNEVALLLGIYGITALAGDSYARAATLFPRPVASTWSGSRAVGSSCSSFSATSCGSSGGSSCGGGGGGGCGGCGG